MKTTATKQLQTETAQPKANKQAGAQQILQRYKQQTSQLQAAEEEELLQGKFDNTQRMELDEEEPLQGKFDTVQRMGIDEEEPVQGKFATTQLAAEEDAVAVKTNNTGLPDNLKSGIENLSGYSMDDVKVHYNSDKPAQLQAYAYAQGTDIHIAPGQEKHLPHEAWHIVQQKQGRVRPTMQMKGNVNVNDDAGLEKEADVMGAKAHNTSQKVKSDNLKINITTKNGNIQFKGVKSELIASHINFENFKEETDEISEHVSEISKAIYNNYKPPKAISYDINTQTHVESIKMDQDIIDKKNRNKNNSLETVAQDHAFRLNNWSRNAVLASSRLFAELRGAVDITGGRDLATIKFGMDTDKEPDVMIESLHRQFIEQAIESKQISSDAQGAVDTHVYKGFKQLIKRNAEEYILYLEIKNIENPWPYTPTALRRMIGRGVPLSGDEIIKVGKARASKYGNCDKKLDREIRIVLKSENPFIGNKDFIVKPDLLNI